MVQNCIYTFILIGDTKVGKSEFIRTMYNYTHTVSSRYNPTIGIKYYCERLEHNNTKCKLQYWDTSGDTRYRSLLYDYVPMSDAILLFFDITNHKSFINLHMWKSILDYINVNNICPIILIGTKCDNAQNREITTLEATSLANQLGATYVECSAKQNINMEEIRFLFISLINTINTKREIIGEYVVDYEKKSICSRICRCLHL